MNHQQPLVSVLMTAYNREKYIAEAIESVIASTYEHWELIIVDDGSTDKTVEIAQAYALTHARIAVYINEQNLGDYPNRNRAAYYAKGIYLKYLDADDTIYPHGLEAMVHAMEQYPDAAYGFSFFGQQDDSTKFPILFTSQQSFKEHFLQKAFFYQGPGGAIIRKKYFDLVGGFSGKRYIGDTELWMKLSLKYSCVLFWPTLIWWRKHEQQENVSEKKDYYALVSRHLLAMEMLKSNNNPLSVEERELAQVMFTRIYCHKIIRHLMAGNIAAVQILRKGFQVSLLQIIVSILPKLMIKKWYLHI